MKKLFYLIVIVLISSLVLAGCSLLSNISQVPANEQSGITCLTKSFSNLVGMWHFDEETGIIVFDSSVNANHGEVHEAIMGVSGKFGNALYFDGVNDYVDFGEVVDDSITTGITLEAWIKYSYIKNSGIISNDLTWISKKGYDFFIENGKLGIDVGNGAKVGRVLYTMPTPNSADPVWHHVAATWNGVTVMLYVDGDEVGTAASLDGTYSTPDKATFVGKINTLPNYQAYIYPFKGFIDEVRIWDIALTEFQLDPVTVAIDIKPGSCPNPLNVKSQGVLPVAILGTAGFDVTQVDPATVKLEGVASLRWAIEDVATPSEECNTLGPDGYLDLTLKFDTQEILGKLNLSTSDLVDESEIVLSDLEDGDCLMLTLTGYLYDGTPIRGEDTVLIIKKGK